MTKVSNHSFQFVTQIAEHAILPDPLRSEIAEFSLHSESVRKNLGVGCIADLASVNQAKRVFAGDEDLVLYKLSKFFKTYEEMIHYIWSRGASSIEVGDEVYMHKVAKDKKEDPITTFAYIDDYSKQAMVDIVPVCEMSCYKIKACISVIENSMMQDTYGMLRELYSVLVASERYTYISLEAFGRFFSEEERNALPPHANLPKLKNPPRPTVKSPLPVAAGETTETGYKAVIPSNTRYQRPIASSIPEGPKLINWKDGVKKSPAFDSPRFQVGDLEVEVLSKDTFAGMVFHENGLFDPPNDESFSPYPRFLASKYSEMNAFSESFHHDNPDVVEKLSISDDDVAYTVPLDEHDLVRLYKFCKTLVVAYRKVPSSDTLEAIGHCIKMLISDLGTKFGEKVEKAMWDPKEEFKGTAKEFVVWFPRNYWVKPFRYGLPIGQFPLMHGEDLMVQHPLTDAMRAELQGRIDADLQTELPPVGQRFTFYLHLMRMCFLMGIEPEVEVNVIDEEETAPEVEVVSPVWHV